MGICCLSFICFYLLLLYKDTILLILQQCLSQAIGCPPADFDGMVIGVNGDLMQPCIAYLEGEYQEQDVCAGVPVILGKSGMEGVVELSLNEEELALFGQSVAAVRKTNDKIK